MRNIFIFLLILFTLKKNIICILLSSNGRSDIHDYLRQIFRLDSLDLFGHKVDRNPQIYSVYDFIIVGGGSSGCVLANRLSENPDHKILLIEAGGTENIIHQIPMMVGFLQSTASNWGYYSEPQKHSCYGMKNRNCALPRGKVLGGTSSINYMIYNRGNRRDFDNWALDGNTGWSYRDVLPYFLKSEDAHLNGLENSPYHGRDGPLSVTDTPYRTNLVHAFVKAAKQTGYPEVDYNGESQLGVSYVQGTTKFGQRVSAAKAFIEPIRNRQNLHILTDSRVTKVLIDAVSKQARAVQFVSDHKLYTVSTRREIILSAGSFNTPQLLMLSGVGPSDNLNAIGIPIIKELPVGKSLYDHMSHIGPTFLLNSVGSTIRISDTSLRDLTDFKTGRGGKFSVIGGVEALTFIKTPNSRMPIDVPDAEIIFLPIGLDADEGTGLKRGLNLKDEIYDKLYQPLEKRREDHYSVVIMHFHPKSTGRVWLASKDPFQWPKIDPNYFSDAEDAETLFYGIKAAIKISEAPALQELGVRLLNISVPGCESYSFGSDDYWRCSVRTVSATLHHQVGTCKMGPVSDPTSVVNHELKVHGIKFLRVVDTSIIPKPPTAHTNAAAIMIGEKAADMIKSSWK